MKHSVCLASMATFLSGVAVATAQPSLDAYEQRLSVIRNQLPTVVAAAEAAADRVAQKPETSLVYPLAERYKSFIYEYTGRAGGIAKSGFGSGPRRAVNTGDVVVVATRSWDQDAAAILPELENCRQKDCLVVAVGSGAGHPKGGAWTYLLDNGAPSAEAVHGPVNAAANITLGWMWCCEYAAALTRRGKTPGVLWSNALNDSRAHNDPLRTPDGRAWLGKAEAPIAAGDLSAVYLHRIEKLIADLRSPAFQGELTRAADIIAERMRQGHTVHLSGIGHTVQYEILKNDARTKWTTIHPSLLKRTLETFRNGDLFVWIGYMGLIGLESKELSLLPYLQGKGVDAIICEAPLPDAGNTPPDLLSRVAWDILHRPPSPSPIVATVDQRWALPDAEVPIAWAPGRMAPVSGVNALLLLRMLDDEVARRL